ncbi:MCE family protein [Ramlibacter sp. USB13]|uniref:MCE family protein n=1 Tax=Ramlibacter cellulosilyticus TaxID=2764187 RepID=A0A923MSR7_9BURK|nr:MlaD family protein [Ramlibacter cellulosilyticus]MBC5785147.1 MCE family protein [Ramlibacter cellulosilyticus]
MAQDPPRTPPPSPSAPPQPETPVQKSEPTAKHVPVRNLELKATLLLAFTVGLIIASALFLLRARGFFDPKQHLVLVTDNAEGVVAGMDLTFSGFPIGTVKRVSLGEKGNVQIEIDVLQKEAKWLRTSSVFTLIKPIIGATQLRAYSGILTDPPLPDGAERPVLRGDFNEEVGRVIGATKDVLDNLNQLTAANSELNRSLANLQVFTSKLQSRQGALHAIFGNEQDARKLVDAVERANAAMAQIQRLAANGDRLVSNADARVFGPNGIANDAQASVRQMNALLSDARGSLQRVDAVLKEAQGIAGNVNKATEDLGSLRGDVEANLRKIEDLINDLNRKWPFAKERKIELP